MPNIRGSSPPGGHDEARGARGACQADSHAIGSSSLGSHVQPPSSRWGKGGAADAKFDFLALKTYKQWKPVDGEGTSKLLKEGVERSFGLIKNAIDSTFWMKPRQARAVLSDLVAEFKMMFHELFVMEVNLFYEERGDAQQGPRRAPQQRQQGAVLGASHEAASHGLHGYSWRSQLCHGGRGAYYGPTPN